MAYLSADWLFIMCVTRSEGFLCLPKHCSRDVGGCIDRICNGQFRWQSIISVILMLIELTRSMALFFSALTQVLVLSTVNCGIRYVAVILTQCRVAFHYSIVCECDFYKISDDTRCILIQENRYIFYTFSMFCFIFYVCGCFD